MVYGSILGRVRLLSGTLNQLFFVFLDLLNVNFGKICNLNSRYCERKMICMFVLVVENIENAAPVQIKRPTEIL